MKNRIICLFLVFSLCFPLLVSCNGVIDRFLNQNEPDIETEDPDDGENQENNEEDNSGNSAEDSESSAENSTESDINSKLQYALSKIDVPRRFKVVYTIDESKLQKVAADATAKLKKYAEENGTGFIKTCSEDYQYVPSENNNWTCGMYTGSYLMAYQITGDEWFADVVNEHIESYVEREANRVGMDDHDIGFVFVPSCVGAYKVLGSETAREAALGAVDYFYETGYSKEGKFIIRAHKSWSSGGGCRTMIDSMMNSTLFFWAGEEIGNSNYFNAGSDHTNTTIDLILRDDGSTYHHYQFDPLTAEPVRGLTWQGYADESCWSRGQSWAIYGFSIAYSYTKSSKIYDAQRDATYYMLNHLSSELIPCWDYTFKYEDVPKDSSAAAIAVCGMLDMASYLPENSAQRLVYESAAAQIMEALIDKCTTDIGVEYDGLIHSATHGVPQGLAIEECSPYADYFYLEALARYLKHDFIRPW